jgi:hypothetical protein
LSEYQVRRAAGRLKTRGILDTKVRKARGGNPTLHYRLDRQVFLISFLEFLKERKARSSGNESSKSKPTSNRNSPKRLPSGITSTYTQNELAGENAPVTGLKTGPNLPAAETVKMAEKLKSHILGNNPKAKVPADLTKWAQDFELMMTQDNRTEDEIYQVIEFSQSNRFWMANILSAATLRAKFDQLFLKAKNEANYGTYRGHHEEVHAYTDAELKASIGKPLFPEEGDDDN